MTTTTTGLTIRPMAPCDLNLILSTWLNSFRSSAFAAGVEVDPQGDLACGSTATVKGRRIHREHQAVPKARRRLSLGITDTVYFYEQRALATALVKLCPVDVLCFESDPDVVVGWLCSDVQDGTPVVHYVYVKKDHRGVGHAYRLLAHRGITRQTPAFFTHQPPPVLDSRGGAVRGSHWKDGWARSSNWIYDPYVLAWSLARHIARQGEAGGTKDEDQDSAIQDRGDVRRDEADVARRREVRADPPGDGA